MTEKELKLLIGTIVKSEISKLEERISNKLATIISETVSTAYTTMSAINKSVNTTNLRENTQVQPHRPSRTVKSPLESILSETKPFSSAEQYGESVPTSVLEMIGGGRGEQFATIDEQMPSVVLDINDRPVSTNNPNVDKVLNVLAKHDFRHTLDVMNKAAKQHRGA